MSPIQAWPKQASRPAGDYRIFKIRTDTRVSPRTGQSHEFHVLESVPWVNVIALTPARELVLIEQFRHGTETVELEIPGGVVDPTDASPLETAVRELREETGYAGINPQIIGQVYANPAIMNNSCFTALVSHCQLKHPVEFDHTEDIITTLVPADQIPAWVQNGRIRHSLVVAALYFFELWQRQNPPSP
jgi:ADP-ribose pyrophosphatase